LSSFLPEAYESIESSGRRENRAHWSPHKAVPVHKLSTACYAKLSIARIEEQISTEGLWRTGPEIVILEEQSVPERSTSKDKNLDEHK
jgi:hypothetical protein